MHNKSNIALTFIKHVKCPVLLLSQETTQNKQKPKKQDVFEAGAVRILKTVLLLVCVQINRYTNSTYPLGINLRLYSFVPNHQSTTLHTFVSSAYHTVLPNISTYQRVYFTF